MNSPTASTVQLTSSRHVTPKGQTRDPTIFVAPYLHNGVDRCMVLPIVTMCLSSTVMEIWLFEVLPGRLFQEQRSVVGQSVLNITLILYSRLRYVRNVAREE